MKKRRKAREAWACFGCYTIRRTKEDFRYRDCWSFAKPHIMADIVKVLEVLPKRRRKP